ncbi:MAG TPA: hypothetical protein VHG72_19965 [Polyangia bacterium]|nr:hypothetical protein [Polyangia bacterium]
MCRDSFATAVAIGLVIAFHALPAAGQACCAGAALVNPARLALHEDYAIGLQARVRADLGSFDPRGNYSSSATEQDVEQDLAGSIRLTERSQAGAVLPLVETRRIESGVPTWGSGIGDLALNARYDFVLPSEALYWPGFGVMTALLIPTGKPVGEGNDPSSTDATGTGTYNLSVGVEIQKVSGSFYFLFDGWVTYCWGRTVQIPGSAALTTSFPLQWTALGVAGYVFPNEAALGLYVNFLARPDDRLNGDLQPGSALQLTTAGLSGVLPIRDVWRVQGSVFSDVLISPFGRNELGGAGVSAALVRVWM